MTDLSLSEAAVAAIGVDLQAVLKLMKRMPIVLKDEKSVQKSIEDVLTAHGVEHKREVRLSPADIVDFMLPGGIAVEVKLGGQARAIYRQCERYCEHQNVRVLVLLTSKTMGFPPEIKGKPAYLISLSAGWL